MKKIALIFGIMIVGVIVLLETSTSHKKKIAIPESELEYDDVWWGN